MKILPGSGTMNLRQIFKQFIAGTLFVLFAIICMIGNILFIPIIVFRLNRFKAIENFARDKVASAWRFFIKMTEMFGYLEYKFDLKGEFNTGSQMIIANHPSLLDVVFLVPKFKRINCIVKGSLSKNIFLFAAIRACKYIPNTQNDELLQKSIEVLKNGENLLIFPEGTRTKDEIVFHKAAAYIAVKGAKSVSLLAIRMSPRSLKKDQPWYKTPSVRIKYDFKEIFSLDMSKFMMHKPDLVRARRLHEDIIKIYKEEFDERAD